MNNLNAVICEGDIDGFVLKDGILDFEIIVTRKYKKNGENKVEENHFNCLAYGKMAEAWEKNFKLGKTIRVVGRLKQWHLGDTEYSEVVIVAEHIEIK